MQTRPYFHHDLEQAFYKAIASQNMQLFHALLPLLKSRHTGSSLSTRDNKGNNFFIHALEANNVTAAKILIKELEADIFRVDAAGRTFMWHAAKHGLFELVALLFERTDTDFAFTHQAAFWFRPDVNGDTPLHMAVLAEKGEPIKTLLFLTERISREKNAIEIINRTNRKGRTAFFYASRRVVKDNHQNNFAIMNILVNAGADIGLLDNKMGMSRLGFCYYTAPQQQILSQWWGKRESRTNAEKALYVYQQVSTDRDTLAKLLYLINYKLTALQKKLKEYDYSLITTAVKLFLILLFWIANLYWILVKPLLSDNTQKIMGSSLTIMLQFTFFIFSSLALILNFKNFQEDVILPKASWPDLKKRIKKEVVDKLHSLFQQEELTQNKLSPVNLLTVVKLENQIAFLNIATPIDEAIQHLKDLAITMDDIIGELNATQRPLSIFTSSVKVEEIESSPLTKNNFITP